MNDSASGHEVGNGIWLSDGGEMGALMRAHDWTSTLGTPATWPQSLKTATAILLHSAVSMVMLWGEDGIMIYNDAYSVFAGDRHPQLLGSKVRDGWPEVADFNDNVMKVVLAGGTLAYEDQELTLHRNGAPEQVWMNLDYSPVFDETGRPAGVIAIVIETTARLLAERLDLAERERLEQMFEQAPSFMAMLRGPDHVIEMANPAYLQLVGHRDVTGKSVRQALPEVEGQGFFEILDEIYRTGKPFVGNTSAVELQRTPGARLERRCVDFVYQPITDATGAVAGIFVEGSDVTERKRIEDLRAAQSGLLELAIKDASLETALEELVLMVEAQSPSRMLGSILLLDKDGIHLRHGAGPNLPPAYNGAIDGIAIGPSVGSCGTAAHNKSPVYVSDIATDPLWADFRDLALSHGLRACWSTPILSGQGIVLGTFAMYYDQPREPAPADLELVDIVTRSASLVIERKQAEATLLASETRLRLAVEAGQIGEWELDVATDTSVRAPRHDRIFGYEEPLQNWGFEAFLSHVVPEDRDRVEAAFRTAANTGSGWHFECRIRRANDGEVRWIAAHSEPQLAADGHLLRLFGLVQDITEQRQAQEALRELNETLEARVAERTAERDRIWRLSQDLLGVADTEGRWTSINPAWMLVLGWSEAEIVGRTSEWLEHPDDQEKTRAEVAHLAAGGNTFAFENRFRHRDGTYRSLSWTAVPEGGFLYCVARDVTAEREREEALRQAEEALRQSQKMEAVGQLTGGIAHDFNNMLAVVIGSLDLLGRRLGDGDARVRRYVDAAAEGARRAALLTQRLLAFSRQQPLNPETIDANRLVSGMSELLRHSLGADIHFETVLAGGLWRTKADTNQLENVILNLAVNARDAMGHGGRLTIETQNAHLDARYAAAHLGVPSGQYVLIAVTDTGSGMPADVIAKAFDPFFTTKEVGKGTGLGLSQVYGFVKQSGGHVTIYSEPDQGTTVKIYLPRLLGAEHELVDEAIEADVPLGDQQEVVLVVEDEPAVRQFSVDALTELGYRVLEADGAASALRQLDAHPEIALMFTDVVMPEVNGAKLAEEARGRKPDLKVLFTTGYTRNAVVHNGALDPGVELIGKPFTLEELAAKVRDVLDAPNAPGDS